MSEQFQAKCRAFFAEFIPALADARVAETRVCVYNNTRDDDFIVDWHPQLDGVLLVTGFSGHGFKFGGSIFYIQDNHFFGAYQNAVESLAVGGDYGGAYDNLVSGKLFIKPASGIFAGLGPEAPRLLNKLPNNSYGTDCVHERLMKAGGKICGIGVDLSEAPFIHYVEEAAEVPFRYKRVFTGQVRQEGILRKHGWISSIPIQAANGHPDGIAGMIPKRSMLYVG